VASPNQLDISVEASQGLERRITVRVPNDEIEREIDTRLKKMSKTARLKGFRPGKVPPNVVRKRYGGQVRQEVVGEIIRSSFSHAVAQQQMTPAGGPAIEPLDEADDTHFSYRATFEVFPEVELSDLAKLEFETPEVSIEQADVDRMIERLRKQKGSWTSVDRPAAEDDRVVIDFVGRIGDEVFEGGEGKNLKVVLGQGQVIADFEKALIGVTAGEEKSAKVKFPKDYGAENLAGKRAVFDIVVHRVEALELPAVNEEFMRASTKNSVLDALHDAHAVELPRALVHEEVHALQHEAMRRMGTEDHDQAPPAESFRPIAEKRVRLSLLIRELISRHGIELDRDRVEARIQELASPYEQPEEAAQLYRGNRELMGQIESAVLEDQVVDFLVEQGQAKPRKLSFDEFMKMQDAD
jgi:trigger factor